MTAKTPVTSGTTKRRGVSPAVNVILSIVFLVLGAVLVVALVVPAIFLAMASDSCTGGECTLIEIGFWWALVTPSVAWLATLVATIVLLVQRRGAWLFALLGLVAVGLTFALGVALVFAPLG